MEKSKPEYWIGKVSGSKEEIKSALQSLRDIPNDANQLQREITRKMREELGQLLLQADEQHKDSPY